MFANLATKMFHSCWWFFLKGQPAWTRGSVVSLQLCLILKAQLEDLADPVEICFRDSGRRLRWVVNVHRWMLIAHGESWIYSIHNGLIGNIVYTIVNNDEWLRYIHVACTYCTNTDQWLYQCSAMAIAWVETTNLSKIGTRWLLLQIKRGINLISTNFNMFWGMSTAVAAVLNPHMDRRLITIHFGDTALAHAVGCQWSFAVGY